MLPYQNYSTNQYQQPMYQQPYQNPYMDNRMNFLQQYQQSLQPGNQGINGKVVESIDIVKATDIPMDGNSYYFPKADGTEIYSKQWLQNGQTRILTFKPLLEDNPNTLSSDEEKSKFDAFNEVLEGIQTKVDLLSDKIDEILKPKTTQKSRKEVVADE